MLYGIEDFILPFTVVVATLVTFGFPNYLNFTRSVSGDSFLANQFGITFFTRTSDWGLILDCLDKARALVGNFGI